MNKIYYLLALTIVFIIEGCSSNIAKVEAAQSAAATDDAGAITDVNAKTAHRLLSQSNDIIILDVRTPAEFEMGHIKTAKNVDYFASDFKEQLAQLDRNEHYLLHCRSGRRSGKSLEIMKELGFRKITHMAGGFESWKAANLPIEKQ